MLKSAVRREEKEENISLKNQKIVVVGGSSGMGLAAAQALAKAGAAVVIASRSQEKLDTAKNSISGEVQTCRLDFTDEPMVDKFFTKIGKIDHLFEQTGNNLPVKRIGKPEEIADAVVFLVSNGFVTGTVLDVDGGARLS